MISTTAFLLQEEVATCSTIFFTSDTAPNECYVGRVIIVNVEALDEVVEEKGTK